MEKCEKQLKFHKFQKFITKCHRYYKVRQNLSQSVAGIIKCDRKLLQSMTGITKSYNYCKVRRSKSKTHIMKTYFDTRNSVFL